MKKIILSILSFGLLTIGQLSAQNRTTVLGTSLVAKIDVTGKWSGKRQQYTPDKRSFIEVFEYEFDLKQEGNIVSGTTTIINRNGEYADMKISGMIVGNKLIFDVPDFGKTVENMIEIDGENILLESVPYSIVRPVAK